MNQLINGMFQFKTNYSKKIMHACRYHSPTHTHIHTHKHTHDLQRELTLHRNHHEINTFYVALKTLIDLWIHLLCLRKGSLALFPDYRNKESDSESAATF